MNNVDLIIKYLSGEMNQEEAGSFEQEVVSDPALKEEYEAVSAAFQLIRDQLRQRDEDSFRAKLLEVMGKPASRGSQSRFLTGTRWYLLLPVAACLAILLALFLWNPGPDRILSRYFEPALDPVILAFQQGTRGTSQEGISLYHKGLYREAMEKSTEILDREPGNQLASLYLLLASMEIDRQEEVLEQILALDLDPAQQLGRSLRWYASLALVKSNRPKEAQLLLQPLAEQQGSYQNGAKRLLKVLLK